MSQAFDHIVQELDQISQQEKYALRELLDEKLATSGENGTSLGRPSAFGWAKGRVLIAADFDAPLDDFEDYVEWKCCSTPQPVFAHHALTHSRYSRDFVE